MMSDPPSAPAPHPLKPAWLIELGWAERYELIEVIGRGGMGQVWKGRDLVTQEVVALKVLDPSRVGDDHLLARLETEAATLKRLLAAGKHRHIVPVLDFATHQTNACMVMAFIPGLDLRTWCATHRLDLRARVAFIERVARAAGWCHQNGVVHRDLKPANILVHATTREPVIVDFSIAKSLGQLPITLTGEALGTAPYMAPEQLDPTRGEVTPASDVYALGATLYELLTHVLPHPGGMSQIMDRHRNEVRVARPSVLDPSVPKDLDSICLKALAHRPDERYEDGTQFADDLASFLAGGPVMARPVSTLGYVVRQARRRPVLSASLCGCVVLGLCLLAGGWQMQRARRADELTQTVETAISGRSWSAGELQRMDVTMTQLAAVAPARAEAERGRWKEDVIADVQAALLRPRLAEGDTEWIPAALDWLRGVDAGEAARLTVQYSDRLERWETFADVRPPFQSLGGLFPNHDVRVDGDALLPKSAVQGAESSLVMVKQPMVSPCEVTALFTPASQRPLSVAMAFEFNQVRTRMVLARANTLPPEWRTKVEGAVENDRVFVLCLERQGKLVQGVAVPDATLANRRFSMRMRVEPDHVRCDVDERWSLRMDEEFIIPQFSPQNSLRLQWAKDLRLHSLVIRNRAEKRQISPLEMGDVLAAQGRWAEARRRFEAHTGDGASGQEASWKADYAAYQQGQVAEALAGWQALASHPASSWRDLALYELWKHHALHEGLAQAAPFLQSLLATGAAGRAFHSHISTEDRKLLLARYGKVGEAVNVLHPSTDSLDQAVKVCDLLDLPRVVTASRLAIARHLSGLDEAAREMWSNGLDDAIKLEGLSGPSDSEQTAACDCLEAWCRVDASENEKRLAGYIAKWEKVGRGDPALMAVAEMEEARKKARAGKALFAMNQVQTLIQRKELGRWQAVRARLLEGCVQRDQGREEAALISWKKGIAAAADDHEPPGIVNLCDLFALRLLSGTWDRDSASALVLGLVARSGGPASVEFQGGLASTMLGDPGFVASLNSLAEDARCRSILRDYVLVNEPARQSMKRVLALVLEHYFWTSVFPANADSVHENRVRMTVENLMKSAEVGGSNGVAFTSFLKAWVGPSNRELMLAQDSHTYTSVLAAQLRWLLGEKYVSRGDVSAARPLLRAAQSEPALTSEWKQRIETLLEVQIPP